MFSAIDEIFRDFSKHAPAPALVYAVSKNGKILHSRAVGYLDLEKKSPCQESSLFRIASMSKSFAAVAAMILRDEGRLDLNAPLGNSVGQTRLSTDLASLTVKALMSMTSGLPTDDPWADRLLGYSDDQYAELYGRDWLFIAPSGSKYSYSNLSYMLLGRVISHASGISATKFILDRICKPLELTDTAWHLTANQSVNSAKGYQDRNGNWYQEPLLESSGDGAVFAGLWSNVQDISKWVHFLGSEDEGDNNYSSILSQASRNELQTPCVFGGTRIVSLGTNSIAKSVYESYCLGLKQFTVSSRNYFGHSGGLPGYGSHMRWQRSAGYAVAALSNATYAQVWQPCAEALELLMGETNAPARGFTQNALTRFKLPEPVLAVLDSVVEKLLSLINGWDDKLAQRLFSNNVFLDCQPQQIREQIENAGKCLAENYTVEKMAPNGLSQEIRLISHALEIHLQLSLSPEPMGTIQELKIEFVSSPNKPLKSAVDWLTYQLSPGTCDERELAVKFAVDKRTLDRLNALREALGDLQSHYLDQCDGQTQFRLKAIGLNAEAKIEIVLKDDQTLELIKIS